MPQFRFEATDSVGAVRTGTIEAADPNSAVATLAAQGLRLRTITGSLPAARPVPADLTPAAAIRPARPDPTVRTTRSSRSEREFLYYNLANLTRAGLGLPQMLTELASRAQRSALRDALGSLARSTSEGRSLADEMARFPDVFPPQAVGAVRAGETGGYLPEACAALGDLAKNDRKVSFWARTLRVMSTLALAGIGYGIAMTVTVDKLMASIFASDHELTIAERLGLLGQSFLQALSGVGGWVVAFVFVAAFVTGRFMRRTELLPNRHRWALKIPVVGGYAKRESLAEVSWHLGKLMSSGIAPLNAWRLASAAAPNVEFGQMLQNASVSSHEGTKLSEIVRSSGVFPLDHAGLIETAEMAGSLPQGLDQSADLSRREAEFASKGLRTALAVTATTVSAICVLIVVATFYSGFYSSMIKHALEGT